MRNMIEKLGDIWCEVVHDSPMWPIHGEYECRQCGRHHQVVWGNSRPANAAGLTLVAVGRKAA